MTEYKITLTDIKGVGGRVEERLADVGIESVGDLRILARKSHTYRELYNSRLPDQTLNRLHEIGKAVKGRGQSYVDRAALTSNIGDGRSVNINEIEEEDCDGSDAEDVEVPSFDTETLAAALSVFHDNYGDRFPDWRDFRADLRRHVDTLDFDVDIPERIVMGVVRYQLDAETLTNYDEMDDKLVAAVVTLAQEQLDADETLTSEHTVVEAEHA